MTDQDPTNMVEEDALASGWSLVDDDGDVESITSDDSSTTDFLVDRPSLANADAVRVVPITDFHDLVMVEISSADCAAATLVDLESDADIVQIDEVTDDNLDDWVTDQVDHRRRHSADSVPKSHVMQPREDDESSECSTGSSDTSSWTAESVHEAVVENDQPEDDLSPPIEELPSDYPQGYRSSIRAYVHQRNNDANNCLTILLFVVLTVVSAVAFGHFRGTTVITRHSPHGSMSFEPIPTTSSSVLSDIQKDQIEILKQLQQMLNIQVELKQRIVTLEDENKDLRLRLLESRKRCTRILHKSAGASESPVSPSANVSDDRYGSTVEDPSVMKTVPIFDFNPQPDLRRPIALPLSLSAVVRAKTAAKNIRTNFQPVAPSIRTTFQPVAPPVAEVEKAEIPVSRPRPEDLKLTKSVFRAVSDRYLKIAKEQVDFVMIEDVVVPLDRLLGARQQGFRPVPPARQSKDSFIEMEPQRDVKELWEENRKKISEKKILSEKKTNLVAQSERLFDRNWAYSERSREDFSGRHAEAIAKQHEELLNQQLHLQAIHRRHFEAINNEKETPAVERLSTTTKSKNRSSENRKPNSEESKSEIRTKKIQTSENIKAKIDIVKADIRREKDRIKSSRKQINESTNWKNVSDRVEAKSEKAKKAEKKTKYFSGGRIPDATKRKDGKSADDFCFLKPNKYRKPEKENCKSQFWNSLPNFITKHFGRNKELEKVFRVLGTDIVHSKVFKKVMEEVPKKFKISSEWLDCQWKWWQNFARRESRSSYGDCGGYLTSWQHKHASKNAKEDHKKSRETNEFPKNSKKEQKRDFRKEHTGVMKDMLDTNESNWFFRRASDRAEFRNTIMSAGRRMGNLTSWFFQRAKDREQKRNRFFRDADQDDVAHLGSRHSRKGRIPSDPIYEFLKHRAAWRRTVGQNDF